MRIAVLGCIVAVCVAFLWPTAAQGLGHFLHTSQGLGTPTSTEDGAGSGL